VDTHLIAALNQVGIFINAQSVSELFLEWNLREKK